MTKVCRNYPCTCNLPFQTEPEDNTVVMQETKEHEPESETLNKEVRNVEKLKENNSEMKTKLRGTPKKVKRTSF